MAVVARPKSSVETMAACRPACKLMSQRNKLVHCLHILVDLIVSAQYMMAPRLCLKRSHRMAMTAGMLSVTSTLQLTMDLSLRPMVNLPLAAGHSPAYVFGRIVVCIQRRCTGSLFAIWTRRQLADQLCACPLGDVHMSRGPKPLPKHLRSPIHSVQP